MSTPKHVHPNAVELWVSSGPGPGPDRDTPGGRLENDCACSVAPAVPRDLTFQVQLSSARYRHPREYLDLSMPRGYHLLFTPAGPFGTVLLAPSTYARWQRFVEPARLETDIDEALKAHGLLRAADGREAGRPVLPWEPPPDRLTVWLHVTDACNLACTYCYVPKRPRAMDLEQGRHTLQSLLSRAQAEGFRQVKLKYAGGEPTLFFERVQAWHMDARQQAQRLGLEFEAVLLTNATRLTRAQALWLREEGVRVAISLDGLGPVHDVLRPPADGRVSPFRRLARTVDEVLLPMGMRPSVTITVTAHNAAHLAETLRWVLARELPFSINFYRQPWALQAPDDLRWQEEEAIIAGMEAAFQVLEAHLPTWPFLDGLLDRGTGYPHRHPCGVGRNYVVVTPEGRLAACHMRLDADLGDVGAFSRARLAVSPVANPSVDEKEGCQTCLFRYVCAGGCPLEAFRSHGHWRAPSPNCRIYKTLWPQALRLEGLRLMKVHGLLV